jgi:hypothetical protein
LAGAGVSVRASPACVTEPTAAWNAALLRLAARCRQARRLLPGLRRWIATLGARRRRAAGAVACAYRLIKA